MICLVYGESGLSPIILIIYTCIWIPLIEIKKVLLNIGKLNMFYLFDQTEEVAAFSESGEGLMCWRDLIPAAKFKDLNCRSYCCCKCTGSCGRRRAVDGETESEMCSICLVEFEREDMVSQLPRCGHMFHVECIRSWLHRNHITCPLCRSNVDLFMPSTKKKRIIIGSSS